MATNTMLSPHFSLEEMTFTRVAASNVPLPRAVENLRRVCAELLEPVRTLATPVGPVGRIRVHSGYRSEAVNNAVGGSQTSAHKAGRACDFSAFDRKVTPLDIMIAIMGSGLTFDQLIYESPAGHSWIHVGLAESGAATRRQILQCLSPGVFEPFNESDRRLR